MSRNAYPVDHVSDNYLEVEAVSGAHSRSAVALGAKTQHRLYPVAQDLDIKGLEHEICGAVLHDLLLDEAVVVGRGHDKRRTLAAVCACLLHQLDRVHMRQDRIDHHDIGCIILYGFENGISVLRSCIGIHALCAKDTGAGYTVLRRVVADQNLDLLLHGSTSFCFMSPFYHDGN